MSLKLSNDITCASVGTDSFTCASISTSTHRIGDKVELRYLNGKLYVYNVGSGAAVGLVGADVVFDALPSSFHVATMGTNGSLTATVIESELTLSGISVSDFTQEVQDEFTAGILSTLSFDAIIEILSVGEGSAVVLYQVIPASGTSEAELTAASTSLSDAATITTALSTSTVLSTATPTVTVSPVSVTASVPSKIIGALLELPPTSFDEDYTYECSGQTHMPKPMIDQFWRAPTVKARNLDDSGALYLANNYNEQNNFYIFKIFEGTQTLVKHLTNETLHAGVPANLQVVQSWVQSKVFIVNNKLYLWTGHGPGMCLIVFDNLTVGDNTHTCPHSGDGTWEAEIAFSDDTMYYTTGGASTRDLKKKLLSDLSTEIAVCTFDADKHIFKLDTDVNGNLYSFNVDNEQDTEGFFYKIPAGTSTPQLLGSVNTLNPTPAHNYTHFSKAEAYYGGIDIWYDNGYIYYIDISMAAYTGGEGISGGGTKYAAGDPFHVRQFDVTTGAVSTVMELVRTDYFFRDTGGYTSANSAMWYFKDNKMHAFTYPHGSTVLTQKKISTKSEPNVTVNAIGAFESLEVLVNDGTERQLSNTTSNTSITPFTPALPFYELKAKLHGVGSSVLNEWVMNVPSVTKINSVTLGDASTPSTVNATTIGPGTVQYSVDGTTWQTYDTVTGFSPPTSLSEVAISQIYGQDVNATATVAEGHGLSDGDVVTIRGVVAATGGPSAVDAQRFNNYVNIDTDGTSLQDSKPLAVSNVTATTFQYTMLGTVTGGAAGVTAVNNNMKLTYMKVMSPYNLQLRMAVDYTTDVTASLLNDHVNSPLWYNFGDPGHESLGITKDANGNVSGSPWSSLAVGAGAIGVAMLLLPNMKGNGNSLFTGSGTIVTVVHRDLANKEKITAGMQITISGVTGPNAALFNGTHTVHSNDLSVSVDQTRFNIDLEALKSPTNYEIQGTPYYSMGSTGGLALDAANGTSSQAWIGTASALNQGITISYIESGATATHYSTPVVKSIGS